MPLVWSKSTPKTTNKRVIPKTTSKNGHLETNGKAMLVQSMLDPHQEKENLADILVSLH